MERYDNKMKLNWHEHNCNMYTINLTAYLAEDKNKRGNGNNFE